MLCKLATVCQHSYTQEQYKQSDMAVLNFDSPALQLYLGVINSNITIQDYIDSISNTIENNRIKSHLQNYLQKTQELEKAYNIENQECSSRFEIQLGNQQDHYQYYIKNCKGHYCVYISIPAGHALNGKHYDEVPSATFCSADEEDATRWVFGWDYAHANILNIHTIFSYSKVNPERLLDMEIITFNVIEEDVDKYSAFLAQSNL